MSGLGAGLVSGLFSFAVAEPTLDRAVRLESTRVAADDARARAAGLSVEHHADVFSRSTQHVGLVLAALYWRPLQELLHLSPLTLWELALATVAAAVVGVGAAGLSALRHGDLGPTTPGASADETRPDPAHPGSHRRTVPRRTP